MVDIVRVVRCKSFWEYPDVGKLESNQMGSQASCSNVLRHVFIQN